MSGWKHASVEDSADEYILTARLVENNVPALFDSAETRMDEIAWASEARHLSDAHETLDKTVQIEFGLLRAPPFGRVIGDIGQVQFGHGRKTISAHAVRRPLISARRRIRARTLAIASPRAMPLFMPAWTAVRRASNRA